MSGNYRLRRLAVAALALVGCGENPTPTWYDESKAFDHQRDERVQQLMEQGQSYEDAARNFYAEQAQKNTEMSGEYRPLEGDELKRALER
jgi:hypothetical protein